jgi:uncharacterized protein YaiE (UPF0345 family)
MKLGTLLVAMVAAGAATALHGMGASSPLSYTWQSPQTFNGQSITYAEASGKTVPAFGYSNGTVSIYSNPTITCINPDVINNLTQFTIIRVPNGGPLSKSAGQVLYTKSCPYPSTGAWGGIAVNWSAAVSASGPVYPGDRVYLALQVHGSSNGVAFTTGDWPTCPYIGFTVPTTYSLALNFTGVANGGSVTVKSSNGSTIGSYSTNTTISNLLVDAYTLIANPIPNYRVFSWNGAISASQNTGSVQINLTQNLTESIDFESSAQGVTFLFGDLTQTYSGYGGAISVQPSVGTATYTITYKSNTTGATYGPFSYTGTFNGSPVPPGSPTNADTYAVTVAATGNYTGAGSATLTINKANLTIGAADASRAYGASNPAFTATYAGFVGSDGPSSLTTQPTLTTSATTSTGVGSYPITPSGAAAANYAISYTNGALTVNKVGLTVTANNASRTYGTANPSFGATYSGFVNNDTASVVAGSPGFTTAATTSAGVGSYPITPSLGSLSASNYTFGPFNNGTLTINRATLTAAADNQTKTYGSANPTLTYTVSGFVNGDNWTVVSGTPNLSTSVTNATGAGSYAISIGTGTLSAANYTFTTSPGTLTVSKAALTVSANNLTKTYNTANPTLSYSFSGFQNGDTSAALAGSPSLSTTATTTSNVGAYTISVGTGSLSAANYAFAFSNGTLTVTPAPVTFTFSNTNWIADGTVKTATVSPSDPAATFVSSLTGGPAAGNYPISASANGNFSGSGNATLVITNPTPTTFSISPTTFIYNGQPQGPSIVPAPGNATFNDAGNATATVVGNYTVSATAYGAFSGSAASNWSITPKPVTFTIGGVTAGSVTTTYDATPKAISVTASDSAATYTITYAGVGSTSYGPSATAPTSAGTYSATVQGTGNYSGSATVSLTINKATPALTWATPAPITYGTALSATQLNATASFVNGLGQTVPVPGTFTYTPAAGAVLPAGTQSLSLTFAPADSTDFNSNGAGTSLVVNKASLVATADNQTKAYGAANAALTISYTGFVNGDSPASLTAPAASTTAASTSPVGTYPITLSGGSSGNYALTLVSGTLTVTRATLTASADNQTRSYGTANPPLTINYAGFVNGDSPASITPPSASTTATAASGVGTYAISLTGGAAANYSISLQPGTLTVTRAMLTVTAANASKVYGSANPTFAATLSGFVNGDTLSVVTGTPALSTTATSASGIGSYPINAGVGSLAAANYTFGPFVPGTLTVTPAPLVVTANNASRVYGAANPAFSANYSGFVNGDTVAVVAGAPSFVTSATAASGVGSYAVTPSLGSLSAANYTFQTFSPGTLTVTAAALIVTPNNQSRPYNTANPILTYTLSGFVNGDSASVVSGTPVVSTAATTASSVGTYAITAAAGSLSAVNYGFSFGTGVMTVTKATPVVTWTTPGSIVYGTALSSTQLNASANVPGTFSYLPAVGAVPAAGAQALTASFTPTDTTNYSSAAGSVTLTVSKATLTVTANNQTRAYGAANPTLTYAVGGYVNGDNASVVSGLPTLSTVATAASPVGSYAIVPAVGSLAAANYTFVAANGTLTVAKAALTVTANNATRTYGATNPAFTVSLSGFVNGDTASVVTGSATLATTATSASGIGTYAITPALGTLSATNYSFGPFNNGTLTVTRAALTVTANNATRTYGSANPAFTATYSGFVNGDTSSIVAGTPAFSTSATSASAAGTYAVTPALGTLTAANYTFATFIPGTLTVAKAALTVTADNQSRIYGAANPTLSYSINGFVNGDTAAAVSGAATVSTSAVATSAVGTYAITPALGSLTSTNYVFGTFVPGVLTVSKAPLTATADNQTRVYGSPNPTLTIRYTGFVNGDTMAAITMPVASTTATTSSPVGSYPVTLSGGTATNYTLALANGTLTVTPGTLTVTADNQTRVYGAANPTLTYTITGFANGETTNVVTGAASVTTAATAASNAGAYPIVPTAGTLAAANYVFGFANGMLTITPKPVTFAFQNLLQTYDGNLKSATVVASDPAATYTADATKGPDAATYIVSAAATGNYAGTGSDSLVISPAAQTITLSPATATVFAGQPAVFTASGGNNAYVWSGNAGATGSGATVSLTFASAGSYTLSVQNAASGNYTQSNTANATITVLSNHAVTAFCPLASSFTVNDAGSPMHGQTYGRIWQDGGSWNAYLGRSGVRFEVQATAWPSVANIEIQSKAPGGDWTSLATQKPSGTSTTADETLSVMLGDTVPGQPLVPASFQQGAPLTGLWTFRARVQDANGDWSDFSPVVQVTVVLPVASKTVSGQTVPPAGELGNWFTASAVQSYTLQFWIP